MKTYLSSKKIKHIFSYSIRKCPNVERFIYTLKRIVYQILEFYESLEWTRFLDMALNIYLNRKHRTIKMTPNEAELEKNRFKLLSTYKAKYDKIHKKKKSPKYECGQTVRVFRDKGKFRRGYLADFTKEVFKIIKVHTNLPVPRYTLSGLDGEEIKGISLYLYLNNQICLSLSK